MAFRCPPELVLRTASRACRAVVSSQTAAASSGATSAGYLAAVCTELGKPLSIVPQIRPQLLTNQVRILVKYSAINFSDVLKVQGKYQDKPALPFIPGNELSGEIAEVGPAVSHLRPGDKVICIAASGNDGIAQEFVTLGEFCFKIDKASATSLAEGASMIVSYATAQLALVRRANIKATDTVLVTAAAGALGLAAVDLAANVYGATVIGACGGEDKCKLVQSYGAKATVDYTKENLRDRVKEITKGKGVDIVFDVVGGKVLDECLKNIAYEGRLITLGYASGDIPKIPLNTVLVKNYSIHGVFWGSYSQRNIAVFMDSIDSITKLWMQGKIRPHVGQIFPLQQVNEAFESLQNRKSTGKVLVDCGK